MSAADEADERPAQNVQAPHVGPFRRLLGPLHFSGVFWQHVGHWASNPLPDLLLRPLVRGCAWTVYWTVPAVRSALSANHALVQGAAGGATTRRRVVDTLTTFAWCLVERHERLGPRGAAPEAFTVSFEGREHWESATAGGAGVLLVTAHVGMWEAASRLPADRLEREVHLVRERELDPLVQDFLERQLARVSGATYVTHFADDPTLGVALLNAVRDGHLVALQGDRPRSGGRALEVELFGRPFALPAGPAVLARSTGRPLLPVFALREGRRSYRVRFCPPLSAPRTRDARADRQAVADAFARELEAVVRAAPGQWFKFGG